MLKKLLEERKFKKKYNAMKLIYEDSLMELDILRNENEILRGEIKKLIRERNDLDGRNTKQELSNNKRLNGTNQRGKTSSKKNNGTSNNNSKREKVSTTTNKQVDSTNKNN